jgi:hypothetical protein
MIIDTENYDRIILILKYKRVRCRLIIILKSQFQAAGARVISTFVPVFREG